MTGFRTGVLCFCAFLAGCVFIVMWYELKKVFAEKEF